MSRPTIHRVSLNNYPKHIAYHKTIPTTSSIPFIPTQSNAHINVCTGIGIKISIIFNTRLLTIRLARSFTVTTLIDYYNSIYPLSDGLNQYWKTIIETKVIKKNELLVKGSNYNVYFIKSGWLRTYFINTNEQEVSLRFIKKGEIFTSIANLLLMPMGYEYTHAIEDTEVEFFPYKELSYIYKEFFEFNYVARVLYERHLAAVQFRVYMLQLPTALLRYTYLQQFFPDYFQNIKNKYIASYLGVTETSLSRIRSKLK